MPLKQHVFQKYKKIYCNFRFKWCILGKYFYYSPAKGGRAVIIIFRNFLSEVFARIRSGISVQKLRLRTKMSCTKEESTWQ